MKRTTDETYKNWRWWLALFIFSTIGMTTVLIQWAFTKIGDTGRAIGNFGYGSSRRFQSRIDPYVDKLFNWVYQSH